MGFQHFFITILCGIFSVQTWATAKPKPLNHFAAESVASVINEIQTMDNYTRWLSQSMSTEQMEKFKQFVKSHGINGSEKFPKMHFDKNKAYFDKQNYVQFNSGYVTINGHNFKPINKPFVEVVEEVCKKLGCEQATAEFSIFPKAHAGAFKNTMIGALLGGLGGGLFCNFTQTCSSQNGAMTGALGGGLLGLFMSGHNRQTCSGNCTVSCNSQNYGIQAPQGTYAVTPMQAQTQNYWGAPQPCDQNPGYQNCMQTDLNRDLYGPTPSTCNNPSYPTAPTYPYPGQECTTDLCRDQQRAIQSTDKKK